MLAAVTGPTLQLFQLRRVARLRSIRLGAPPRA